MFTLENVKCYLMSSMFVILKKMYVYYDIILINYYVTVLYLYLSYIQNVIKNFITGYLIYFKICFNIYAKRKNF